MSSTFNRLNRGDLSAIIRAALTVVQTESFASYGSGALGQDSCRNPCNGFGTPHYLKRIELLDTTPFVSTANGPNVAGWNQHRAQRNSSMSRQNNSFMGASAARDAL